MGGHYIGGSYLYVLFFRAIWRINGQLSTRFTISRDRRVFGFDIMQYRTIARFLRAQIGTLTPFLVLPMSALLCFRDTRGNSLVNLATTTEIARGDDTEGTFWIHFSSGEDGGTLWEYTSRDERDRVFATIETHCHVVSA